MNIKKEILIIVLFWFFVSPLTSCNQSEDQKDSGKTKLAKVLVISDSIGTGYGKATPFPDRIANAVTVDLVSDSVNGRQTMDGLEIVREQLNLHKPSHLIVLLGTNDAKNGIVETAIENLQEIVEVANGVGVVAIVGTLPPNLRSMEYNEFSSRISSGIRDLNGAEIADIQNSFGDGSTTIADGIHPNDIGQQIIADTFLKRL